MGETVALRIAALDLFMSFLWTLISPSQGVAAFALSEYMDYKGDRTPILYAIILVVSLLFGEASFNLGGPAWNPTGPVAFYVVGASDDSLLTVLIRMPAMAIGAAAGMLVGTSLMPTTYRPMMGNGPQLQVDFYTGALAEGFLTFMINLIVLYVVLRITNNRFLQTPLIITFALLLVHQGASYTGPAMNPSDAFAWEYVNKKHVSSDHIFIYWLSPLVGTVAAALVYRQVFGSPRDAVKEKTAKLAKPVGGEDVLKQKTL